ncbi:9177_t:CDS:1 [Gigaspora margarita]|uniref:9177_t:CDS:1 n=1 Tax=Gigaspora margarita TaxID=4874 RepID=A0ABM8W1Y6_GIGMA|nr:9177_t:CDS:1 [Gigaspora margarita]
MFTCSVFGLMFGHLASLENHKRVYKNHCQIERETDNSMNTYNSDDNNHHVESKTDSSTETDSSIDTYNSNKLDTISRHNNYHVEDETYNSTDTYNSSELDLQA